MKTKYGILAAAMILVLFSCTKEYSLENGQLSDNPDIVGVNCRISTVASYDSATLISLSAISAKINDLDSVVDITHFDSLGNNLLFYSAPFYSADTIFINPDEYFLTDITTGRITRLHGLYDPTNLASQFDADYIYNSSGFLVQKLYTLLSFPLYPVLQVDYTYVGGNLTHMSSTDLTVPELIYDADMDYYTNLQPKHYMYIFPDEKTSGDFNHFSPYTQFFNFGNKSLNAVKKMIVRTYGIGNVVSDSTVCNFIGYNLSRDNYVLSVYMLGGDQPCIPAEEGKIKFSYKCKP